MSAKHVSPQQFKLYHGGPHHFAIGDTVNPTSPSNGGTPVAYASKDPNDAGFFGIVKGNMGPQLPLFVPVYEVSSPASKPSKNASGRYHVSPEGFTVDKLHGYIMARQGNEDETSMQERWLSGPSSVR